MLPPAQGEGARPYLRRRFQTSFIPRFPHFMPKKRQSGVNCGTICGHFIDFQAIMIHRLSTFTSRSFMLTGLAISLAGCATSLTVTPSAVTPAAATAAKPVAATTPAVAPTAAARPPGAPAAAGATPPTAPPAPGTPPPPRPFADVIKDAKETKGWFTTYQKDDKVWLELMPEQIEKPLGFSMNISHGIGEKQLFGNWMGAYGAAQDFYIVAFRKFSPTTVQLIALNAGIGPRDTTPAGFAVERSFSDSLLGTMPVASAPHPERKSFLVELNPIVVSDLAHISFQLEQSYRQGYAFDGRNSSVGKIRATDDQLTVQAKLHYATPRLNVPTPGAPPSPVPYLPPPSTLPDVRSLFMGVQYNFAKLPETAMTPRRADPRVGYFNTAIYDYAGHEKRSPETKVVNRWRLEKKDPAAALSEPKQPIVYWLDKNIPVKYRQPITDGILIWNQAFEKIGFKNAVVVKQQTENDDFDTSDLRHASVRWMVGKNIPFGARGPSAVDPRSGEILDADIEINEAMSRVLTARYAEDTPRPIGLVTRAGALCTYADMKMSELQFSFGLLEARGVLDLNSAEAEGFVADYFRDVMAHEVGHTIGLRHNFRASTIYTNAQLTDPAFTKVSGVTGSVMDYNPVNIALNSEKQAAYWMNTLGPYDFWAVEYGYAEFKPEQESAAIAKIAARSNEPLLAYGTDEDAGFGSALEGIDPTVNRSDLTNDPLAYYAKRVTLARELWDKMEAKRLPVGEPYELLRRNFDRGFAQLADYAELTAKYVGGVVVLRDNAGSGRAPLTHIPADKQRAALKLLADSLFSEDNFKFKPEFLRTLSVDFLQRENSLWGMGSTGNAPSLNLSVPDRVLSLQRSVLSRLTADNVAKRLTDAPALMGEANPALTVTELYTTLQSRIWSELDSTAAPSTARRALQREHLRWLVATIKRDSGNTPGDARVMVRALAKQLQAKLDGARRNGSLSVENRAHFDDAFDQVSSALTAVSAKAGA